MGVIVSLPFAMPPLPAREYAFDGLVGPTHHHAGLSLGNLASFAHGGEPANPRASALEGLRKLRLVQAFGAPRAVLPPHERPHLPSLRRLGFHGSDADVLAQAHAVNPTLLSAVSSASSMWAANAATVCPSSDSLDGRLHLTPANLVAMFHRSLEVPTTTRILRRLFADPLRFCVHDALPAHPDFGDEGAANHLRLSTSAGAVHLFAWGRSAETAAAQLPQRYPARQTRAASESVARLHRLRPSRVVTWQQHPAGIDQGAFHSDVLAVGCGELLLVHELSFLDLPGLTERLRQALGDQLRLVVARESELSAAAAVAAYPFNSELFERADGKRVLLAPRESEASPPSRAFLTRLLEDGAIEELLYVDVNGSMKNGGGPACLRLRVALTEAERAAIGARVFYDAELDRTLTAWVERHYRDRLVLDDLRDPQFLLETRSALDELSSLLDLGSVYEFQQP
jgi:succinylarginine dihydrolase